jgi:nitrate/nitrite transport system ATP-binding protein
MSSGPALRQTAAPAALGGRPLIEIRGLAKSYGAGAARREVLRAIDLDVRAGEFLAILGGSGAGKSTLLSLLAGLERPSAGELLLRGRPIQGPGPERALVFQQHALLPWLSAAGNVALAVDQAFAKEPRAARAERVRRALAMVRLSDATHKLPHQLSGGMRQRVAVARALAVEPELLLMDEPFGALDALTRAALQKELQGLTADRRRTTVFVTNDAAEALLLADRVAVLADDGRLDEPVEVDLPRPRDRELLAASARGRQLLEQLGERLAGGAGRGARRGPQPGPAPTRSGARVEAVLAGSDAQPAGEQRPLLAVRGVEQAFGQGARRALIVQDIHMQVRQGEFVCLLGHSGCGKTTLLNLVAGLARPTRGALELDGLPIERPGPERALVFQAHALLPWLTAFENVRLGLDAERIGGSAAERDQRARYFLERVGLAEHGHLRPAELSAGMRQRIGVARAFALDPRLLLLDEPFGSLDSTTREELQQLVLELWGDGQRAALMVTHDVEEALLLADRILLMTDGPAARIGLELPVPLERPRRLTTHRADPRFLELRRRILDFLAHGAAQPG